MKNQQEMTKILIEVSTLLNKGYDVEFESLISNIKNKEANKEMPEGLQSIFASIKNTPIEEPVLFEIANKISNNEASIIDVVLNFLNDEQIDKYTINDLSFFAGRVLEKVKSLKDENGIFKSTPNTSMWQPPKPSHIKKLDAILRRPANTAEEVELKEVEAQNLLIESSGVILDNLSDWEKTLVVEQSHEAYKGYLNSFLGKR